MVTAQDYIMSAVFSGMGLLAAFFGYLKIKTVRMIKNTPLSSIRDLRPGVVKVKGKASAEKYLKSPFARKDCVAFRWEIKTWESSSSGSRKGPRWSRTSDGQRGVPFTLDDGTGQVAVKPDNAELYLRFKNSFYRRGGFFEGMAKLMQMLKQLSSSVQSTADMGKIDLKELAMEPVKSDDRRILGGLKNGDMMLYEYFIEPGEDVFVLGNARKDPSGKMAISRPKKIIISNKSPEGTVKEAGNIAKVGVIFGIIFFLAGIALLLKSLGYY